MIRDPVAAGTVPPGMILVAPWTDPTWTPLFLTAAGVVVETGSILSHGPVVARELGVPCVVGVEHALQRIKEGDLIELDAGAGTVTLLTFPVAGAAAQEMATPEGADTQVTVVEAVPAEPVESPGSAAVVVEDDTGPWIRRRALLVTLVIEALTVFARFGAKLSAVEFNRNAPLLMQIHHMFWSIPLLVPVYFLGRRSRVSHWLIALALGCIASDLLHHLVVLPVTVGNMGWHWP